MPQTEAQAQRNMIMYLKNTARFRLDYFKGISYDDIRPIFEAKFNSNIKFLLKSKEQIEEEENRALESINETSAQKAAKRRRKFNFSKYIFDSLVRNVDSNSKFYMYPRFIQLIIQNQLAEGIEEQNDAEEQIQGNDNDAQGADADVSGDDVQDQFIPSPAPPTPPPPPQDIPSTFHTRVKKLERDNKVKTLKLRRLKKVGTSQRVDTSDDTIMEDVSNQGRMIDELDIDEGVALMGEKDEENKAKEVKEVVKVVTTAKLIKEVVTAASAPVSAASTIIPTAEPKIHVATITAAPDIDWDVAIDHVKQKAKEDPYV
nr:hypothetical protein [Tanacetum cinerariifolium]